MGRPHHDGTSEPLEPEDDFNRKQRRRQLIGALALRTILGRG
jgi:hypothetical protein